MLLPSPELTLLLLVASFWTQAGGNTYGMDSKLTCIGTGVKMEFLDDGDSAIVLGKNSLAENQAVIKVCKIKFKPVSKRGLDYLRLKFESFYINDCTITLTISQSPDSTFETEVSQLAHLVCEQRSPKFIYTKKDHTVQFTLSRDDIFFRNYNYRINVSLSGGPPETGPSVAVIIGISATLIAVIAIIAFILIKYIRLKDSVLRDRRAERAIESALYLYNSDDAAVANNPRPLTHVAGQGGDTSAASTVSGAQHNGTDHGEGERLLLINIRQPNPQTNGHKPRSGASELISPDQHNESKDSVSLEGEMPPSYEEALEMPKPPDSPVYANT